MQVWSTCVCPRSDQSLLCSAVERSGIGEKQSSQSTGWSEACVNIGIENGFPCINIRQVPRELLKTEAGGRGFQHLPRDLANINAMKNHVRSLLLHKKWKHLLHIALFLLHYFVSPFHRCRANAISTDYARSRAGQYTSRDDSNFVAPVRAYWKLPSRALTARELPC